MTLCIATLCEGKKIGDQVVVSFDARVETAIAGGETEFKLATLSRHWTALIAGDLGLARELVELYKPIMRENEDAITHENALAFLYSPVRELRRNLADRYVYSRVAMSYDEFLQFGLVRLPEDLFRTIAYDVAAQEINVELILIGHIGDEYALYKVSGGLVTRCEPFAVIGSGTYVAEPTLFQREINEAWSTAMAMYAVFEAQWLGRIAPGVGSLSEIAVIAHDEKENCDTFLVANAETKQFLRAKFREFGPRPLDPGLTLPAKPFEDFSDAADE